jgi:hypothetical protein
LVGALLAYRLRWASRVFAELFVFLILSGIETMVLSL